MTKQNRNDVINPFSDEFIPTWQMWKDYKKDAFDFEYKGIYSEQMTLKKLCELSEGDESKAVRIIEQSIMRQWAGLFPLHIPSTNGKSKQKTSGTNNSGTGTKVVDIRGGVQEAIDKRNREQQQGGNQYGSKAV